MRSTAATFFFVRVPLWSKYRGRGLALLLCLEGGVKVVLARCVCRVYALRLPGGTIGGRGIKALYTPRRQCLPAFFVLFAAGGSVRTCVAFTLDSPSIVGEYCTTDKLPFVFLSAIAHPRRLLLYALHSIIAHVGIRWRI